MKPRIFKCNGFWFIAWPEGGVTWTVFGFESAVRLATAGIIQRNAELNDFAAQAAQGRA